MNAITPRIAERVAFVLATPTEPAHQQARQMCKWLNVWCERQQFTAEQRFALRTLVGHLDGLARRLEADHMARAKPRRLRLWCRVRRLFA